MRGADGDSEGKITQELLRLSADRDTINRRIAELEARLKSTPTTHDTCENDDGDCGVEVEESRIWDRAGHGLSVADVARYSRQLLVPRFGVKGQSRLAASSVLVVGAGGLGAPAALYLAAAGIVAIILKETSQSIIIFQTMAYGCQLPSKYRSPRSKSTVKVNSQSPQSKSAHKCHTSKPNPMRAGCLRLNSSISVEEHLEGLTAANALSLVARYSVVVDATDNVASRYLVSDACIVRGRLTVYGYKNGPCYRCMHPSPPPVAACQTCADDGVVGVVPGVIGCLQALEVLKIVAGWGTPLSERMLLFDAEAGRMTTVKLRGKVEGCAACGSNPTLTSETVPHFDYAEFTKQPMHDKPTLRLHLVDATHSISVHQLSAFLGHLPSSSSSPPHLLIDVRAPHEFAIASLPSSLNFPLPTLHKRMQEVKEAIALKSGEGGGEGGGDGGGFVEGCHVFVICRRGNDSQMAVLKLLGAGVGGTVQDVTGGLLEWSTMVDRHFPVY